MRKLLSVKWGGVKVTAMQVTLTKLTRYQNA